MSLNRRDRAVVVALTLVLVVLGGMLALPRSSPAATPGPSGQPDSSVPPSTGPVVYREGVVGVPQSITPVSAHSRSERTLVGLIFSGLVRLGPDNTLEADLAESWQVDDDGKTWTFKIRDDATWQDGEPVTAADVVFTLSVLKDRDANGAAAASWAAVTAVATDDRTVVMTLDAPVSGFVAAATQPLLPAHLLAGQPMADIPTGDFSRQPVGTGPYTLLDMNDQRAILVPSARLGAPAEESSASPTVDPFASGSPGASPSQASPLDEIELDFFADDAAAADAFRSGSIDGVAGLAPTVQGTVQNLPGVEQIVYPTTTLSTVVLNLHTDHPELRDPRLRKALLGAIDRDALISDVMGGNARSADTLVPPAWALYDADAVKPVKYDPKASAKLLKDAGWKKVDGAWRAPGAKKAYQLVLLTVPADANPRLHAVGQFVRDAWTELGMTVNLVEIPVSDLADRLGAGDFTASVLDITLGLEPDLYPLLASSQARASGGNISGYQDPKLDTLLEAARAQGTHDERAKAWTELLTALNEQQPMLPLAWVDEVVLARGLEGATTRLITGPGDRFWDVLAWRLAADR